MKRRTMLILAAAAATQLAAGPAHAAIPSCFGYTTSSPWKTSLAGADQINAAFGYTNYCDSDHLIDLGLESKFCEFPAPCRYVEIGTNEELARANTSNGFSVTTQCRDGRHRYRMWWGVYTSSGTVLLGEGYGPDLEIECDNTPPPPDIECPKYTPDACRVINPGS